MSHSHTKRKYNGTMLAEKPQNNQGSQQQKNIIKIAETHGILQSTMSTYLNNWDITKRQATEVAEIVRRK
jgi:hypothetical protein